MEKRTGRTIRLQKKIRFAGCASIAGPMEGEGPLGSCFDQVLEDDLWGENTWEKAESKMFYEAVRLAIAKSGMSMEDMHFLLGGDLLNQLIAASFAARQIDIPFLGLYGACSTMAETLSLGSMLLDGGFAEQLVCCATSHFSTAERQFRFPLEMGAQRTPTAQRTVTGAGATVLTSKYGPGPYITHVTIGRVVDFGIKDANNMGAAMAPAAADSILTHLEDTQTRPEDYSAIFTGDLGTFGLEILRDLLIKAGVDPKDVLRDCGAEMFAPEQDTHAGGSGCGCSGITLNGRLIPELQKGELDRILFIATGALMSTVSSQQGERIPGVAHVVQIERGAQ